MQVSLYPLCILHFIINKFTIDDRYQSTKGILYDINRMLSEYSNDSQLKNIRLSEHDYSEHFLVPHRLYGRDLETDVLLSIFQKIQTGNSEIVLIRGVRGSGKSALGYSLNKHIAEYKGLYVTGHYDHSHNDVPYSGILQACEDYCDLVLEESEDKITKQRVQIQNALGKDGKLVTNAVKIFISS